MLERSCDLLRVFLSFEFSIGRASLMELLFSRELADRDRLEALLLLLKDDDFLGALKQRLHYIVWF